MKKIVLSTLALMAISPLTFADNIEQLTKELHALKNKTERLEKQLAALNKKHISQHADQHGGERFGDLTLTRTLGGFDVPHFGTNATYDGAKLLINEPTINKDLGLLRQHQYMDKAYGPVSKTGSRVELSGTFAGQYYRHTDNFGLDGDGSTDVKAASNFYADAELDMSAQLNDWWTGYSKFAADTEDRSLSLSAAFITLGNLNCSPVYSSVGYFYLPFGSYSTHMVSSSLPKIFARTKANAIAVGYSAHGVNASAFAFAGGNHDQADKKVDQFGANLEYVSSKYNVLDNDLSFKLGGSYINNLTSAGGQPSFANSRVNSYVSAYNVRASVNYADFGLVAEYVAPFGEYNYSDLRFNNQAAKATASMYEVFYNFDTLGKSSYVVLNYGETREALGMQLPESQYGVTYSVDLFKHTVLAIEYMHKRDYSRADAALISNGNSTTRTGTGRDDHQVTTELDMYF